MLFTVRKDSGNWVFFLKNIPNEKNPANQEVGQNSETDTAVSTESIKYERRLLTLCLVTRGVAL